MIFFISLELIRPSQEVPLLMLTSFRANAQEYQCGDVNYDGQVSISGVTSLIDYLLSGSWPEDPVSTPDGHEYVDLGLASGTQWVTTNIGAINSEDYSNNYANGI